MCGCQIEIDINPVFVADMEARSTSTVIKFDNKIRSCRINGIKSVAAFQSTFKIAFERRPPKNDIDIATNKHDRKCTDIRYRYS